MLSDKNSTRNQILELIKKTGQMTVKDLSEAIGITTMGIRQHLTSLEGEGLTGSNMRRQKVGRPVQVYSLTESADELFPSGYGHLALSILDELAEMDGPEKVDELLERRKNRLSEAYKQKLEGLSTEEKFKELAKIRDEDGYMCEAVDRDGGKFALVEHHCPIAIVSQKYSVMCSLEISLIEEVLGTKLKRAEHQGSGGKCCCYEQVS